VSVGVWECPLVMLGVSAFDAVQCWSLLVQSGTMVNAGYLWIRGKDKGGADSREVRIVLGG